MPRTGLKPGATATRRTCLQTGFGLGHHFLETWQDWRKAIMRPARLDYIAITPAPVDADTLRRAHAGSKLQPLAEALAAQWPPSTRNVHRLTFDGGQVHLLLAVGPLLDVLPDLRAQVDEFRIDDADGLADAPHTASRIAKGFARLAAQGARLRSGQDEGLALQQLRLALSAAGFAVNDGPPLRATYAPRFVPRRRVPRIDPATDRHALIVGAGLAGCAAAAALAEQGWRCTLLDRRDALAQEASGNPAGLFHGIVNAQDGTHARFNRAAALTAQRTVQWAVDAGLAKGSARGLLRLESSGEDVARMRAELMALRLPPDYVQAIDAAQAGALCGLPLQHPAWFYPGGGWVQPAALARALLQRAGAAAEFHGSVQVQSLRRVGDRWQLLDADGRRIAEAATVVLANAADALRLIGATHWPVQTVRGQISLLPVASAPAWQLPRLPVAGAGYLLPEVDGVATFGASAQPADLDPAARETDHAFNVQRLAELSAQPALPDASMLQGRVGWRCVADDRLPLIGAAPDESRMPGTAERLFDVPRHDGLYLFTGLASRGLSWSVLGGELLAALICGAPLPLEGSLVDALDPARFALRAARRSQRASGASGVSVVPGAGPGSAATS